MTNDLHVVSHKEATAPILGSSLQCAFSLATTGIVDIRDTVGLFMI